MFACGIAAMALAAGANPIRLDPAFSATSLPRNDDGSTGPQALGFALNFYGAGHNTVFVNNNGNLTFVSGLGTFTPFGLTTNLGVEIIAPFFADVDTRNSASGLVTFGRSTVDGHAAFGTNYLDVGYFSGHAERLNDFQVVLIDRSDISGGDFDIEFNYGAIQWETGDASGGSGGLGGSSARAGYSRGSGQPGTFFELPGSGIDGALLDGGSNALISGSFNSLEPGRYLFEVRNGAVDFPGIRPDLPFLPNRTEPGGPGQAPIFFFSNVPGGRWFDPPLVSSYNYTATGSTLFTGVQFAPGFGDAFTLSAAGCTFGGPYTSLVLVDLAALCGGTGISQFTVAGISPFADAGNPAGFPTFLTFNGTTGSFSMQGVTAVPEPATLTLLLTSAFAVARRSSRRRRANNQ